MNDQDRVRAAIQASWTRASSATPDEWNADGPAKGQCEVSSFVAWEHLGGDLVLGQVHLNGQFQEHHYWNRIDGVDLDLTSTQFSGDETITELRVVPAEQLRTDQDAIRPELLKRIAVLRTAVSNHLDTA